MGIIRYLLNNSGCKCLINSIVQSCIFIEKIQYIYSSDIYVAYFNSIFVEINKFCKSFFLFKLKWITIAKSGTVFMNCFFTDTNVVDNIRCLFTSMFVFEIFWKLIYLDNELRGTGRVDEFQSISISKDPANFVAMFDCRSSCIN